MAKCPSLFSRLFGGFESKKGDRKLLEGRDKEANTRAKQYIYKYNKACEMGGGTWTSFAINSNNVYVWRNRVEKETPLNNRGGYLCVTDEDEWESFFLHHPKWFLYFPIDIEKFACKKL